MSLMSVTLFAPMALAALAALLIPLLIHLARRSEQRPTDFAALRWLREKPKPRHRLRFDEWPLLLLRIFLLILLAVWLARPMLEGGASDAPWVAVVPGVDPAVARTSTSDPDARLHWLAPDSPELDQPAPTGSFPIASLLRQLDAELPSDVLLTVLVPEVLQGVDAQRPRLSRAVQWRVLPGTMPSPELASAATVPTLAARHAPERQDAVRYLRAAASAWQPTPKDAAPSSDSNFSAGTVSEALDAEARWLAWLSPGPLPAAIQTWISDGGVALLDSEATFEPRGSRVVAWRDALGQPLVESAAHGKGRVLRLTRALTPASMPQLLEPDFPRRLRALFDTVPPEPTRVAANDYTPTLGGESYPQSPRDLRPWLALLIALTLLFERGLATRRRRGVAP